MGTKKPKNLSGVIDEPSKKTKKPKNADKKIAPKPETGKDAVTVANPDKSLNVPSVPSLEPTPSDNAPVVKPKKSRKRAADFMDDEAAAESDGGVQLDSNEPATTSDEPVKKKAKKSKKSKMSKDGETLAADGVNGEIEHTGEETLETATARKPVSTSMQAEADRTVDHELEDGFGGFASEDDEAGPEDVEADDNAAALLAGFDSDTEDKEDEGLDLGNIPVLPKSKKMQKKLERAKAKANEGPGTVYVGRIPHGFYEKEMRAYFSQFGDISQLRLSRNKRTGASKHFAFIEFEHNSVAKIAAESMDNYLMFGHILKCKYAEPGSLHPDVWKGANKKFRKIPHEKLEREYLAAPKTEEKWQKKVDKEQRKRDKTAEKIKAIGLDMPVSTLTSPSVALKKQVADRDEPKQIGEDQAGAVELPADVPEEDAAVKAPKKSKKEKKSKQEKKDAPEVVSDTKLDMDTIEAPTEAKKEKKTKKAKKREAQVSAVPDAKLAEESEPLAAAEVEAMDVDDESLPEGVALASATETATNGVAKIPIEKSQKKKLTKAEKRVINADRKALQVEKKASRQAQKLAEKSNDAPQPADDDDADDEPGAPADDQADLSADFISLGQFDDDAGKKIKPYKVKKPKKERKNLVKARGPKSKLVATKPKPDPNAEGKIPGLPVMGKGKYDKETRMAHKEEKAKVVAERAAKGLPPHRVRGETQG